MQKSKKLKKSNAVNVVIFDFDGTLSGRDANMQFGKYCFAHSVWPWVWLPVVLVGLVARVLNPNGMFWRQMSRRYATKDVVRRLVPGFVKWHKRERFGWAADQIAKESAAGNIVLLISASPNYLIPKLVDDMKFDAIICSQTEARRPWKFKFLCYEKNKVVALDKWAAKNNVIPNVVRSYGDSRADRFIMARAKEQVWIDPKTGNRKIDN